MSLDSRRGYERENKIGLYFPMVLVFGVLGGIIWLNVRDKNFPDIPSMVKSVQGKVSSLVLMKKGNGL